MRKHFTTLLSAAAAVLVFAPAALAQETGTPAQGSPLAAIAIGLVMALAALGGTSAQGRAISSGLDSIGRNPTAAGKIFTPMLLGLAFIESLVILSFVICFLLLNKF